MSYRSMKSLENSSWSLFDLKWYFMKQLKILREYSLLYVIVIHANPLLLNHTKQIQTGHKSHRNIALIFPSPLHCSPMRHPHEQKHNLPSNENPNSSSTRTMLGSLTEIPCSVWLLLAIIMTNTNQDQNVRKTVVWHRCGLELYSF